MKTKRLILSRTSVIHHYLMLPFGFAAVSTIAVQTIRFKVLEDVENFNISFAFFLGLNIVCVALITTSIFSNQLLLSFNGFLSFFERISDNYACWMNPAIVKTTRITETLLIVSTCGIIGMSTLISIILILFPQAPVTIGFFIPDKYFTLPIRIFVSIAYITAIVLSAANLTAVLQIIIVYLIYMTILVTKEFRICGNARKPTVYLTTNRLRSVKNIMTEYRGTQVLHLNFLLIAGQFLVPVATVVTNLVIFCNYVVISQRNEMNSFVVAMLATWSVAASVFWCAILEVGRYIYGNGNKVLMSWKRTDWGSSNNSLMNKFRVSCKPFMINYGSTFVIRRPTTLKFFKSLTRGTFRVLLTFITVRN
ncbi:unnamed protein product [Orchesella dallaii]|uniref:Odorant receptor n=1 Tax=Orchesella dallaii TaxID=48710 RepID=A0ABP1RP92_9HEXA